MTAAIDITIAEIARVRVDTDLVTLARGVGSELNPAGTRHVGTCPFCRAPGFTVNSETHLAHCWTCKWTGDCYRLLERAFEISFAESFRQLDSMSRAKRRCLGA